MSDAFDPALKERFVHLHAHSHYSFLDGGVTVENLVDRALEQGMPALAVTDHGNMCGAMDLYEACDRTRPDKNSPMAVKPIFGTELYITQDHKKKEGDTYHLLVLAANQQGYKNLIKLNSIGQRDGFYYKPRIDFDALSRHHEGLIVTSTCLAGEAAQAILAGRTDDAEHVVSKYRELLGDRYYLEIQDHGLPEDKTVNYAKLNLAQKLDIPFIVTNDSHYLDRADAHAHDCLLCISTGALLKEQNRFRFENDRFYFKTAEEMWQTVEAPFRDGLFRTHEVAARCDVSLSFGEYFLPKYPDLPEGMSEAQYLRKLAEQGCRERYGKISDAIRERLEKELGVIERMGFPSYFLIVADFINWAKKQDIPVGPGRGSAAGSIVAYATGITNIDPLKYDLLFERFLNESRISMPDIDIDFDPEGRERVIEYTRKKYSEEAVCQIITFSQLKAKAVIKDVGRVMDMPIAEVESITKLVPDAPKMTLAKAFEEQPKLKEIEASSFQLRDLFEVARRIEGMNRHTGIHAAGVIIAPGPVDDYVPLYRQTNNKNQVITTQFAMEHCEQLGLLKMDFLGLRNLTIIKRCEEIVEKVHGRTIDWDAVPLDDPKPYEMLSRGDSYGVFQLESDGMRKLLKQLQPDCFEDLIAVLALYRPGPMEAGMIGDYVEVKHGRRERASMHPQIDDLLEETNGIVLYQEQVMRIAQKMGGFSLAEADNLRKAMGKKKADLMATFKAQFVDGAKANGVSEADASHIFELLAKFAGYGFNKSHSAAYALVTYQTAWLKAHYPVEYEAAIMTCEMGDQSKLTGYLDDARELGIAVRGPDITAGEAGFTVAPLDRQRVEAEAAAAHNGSANGASAKQELYDYEIVFGLAGVKGIGTAVIESVVAEREANGPFESLLDFSERVDPKLVTTKVFETLAGCGALDELARKSYGKDGEAPAEFAKRIRPRLIGAAEHLHAIAQQKARERAGGQRGLFAAAEDEAATAASLEDLLPHAPAWTDPELLAAEKELLGFYFSTHPLTRVAHLLREFASHTSAAVHATEPGTRVSVGGVVGGFREITIKQGKNAGKKMAVFELEDLDGAISCVCFTQAWEECQHDFVREEADGPLVMLVQGSVDTRDENKQVIVDRAIPIERAREALTRLVLIRLREEQISEDAIGRLQRVLQTNRGPVPVRIALYAPQGKVLLKAGPRWQVAPSEHLREAVSDLFGQQALLCLT